MPKVNGKSKLAIASFVLGIVAFIPIIGVLFGIAAIILGIVALATMKSNGLNGRGFSIAGIVLGALGIFFTIVLFSAMLYFAFSATTGPYSELRMKLDKNIMTQIAESLDSYQNKYGRYPDNLRQLVDAGYFITVTDTNAIPICYQAIETGSSYNLKSAGEDRLCHTPDDLLLS